MNANEFVDLVLTKKFESIKEMEQFYNEMCSKFDSMRNEDKEKIKSSMCLEMLDRAIKYNVK